MIPGAPAAILRHAMEQFEEPIRRSLAAHTDLSVEEIRIEVPRDAALGDLAFPCFALAKTLRPSVLWMGSSRMAWTTGRLDAVRPIILCTAGRPNCSKATIELTGLPGSPSRGTRVPFGASSSPKASGFAGRILTDQKSIWPCWASASLTRS